MAIDFQNINRWIASSSLNQVFSQTAASKTSDKAQSEKKDSAAAWVTSKTAQIALSVFAAVVTGTAGYYAYNYLMDSGFKAADALSSTDFVRNQDKPTSIPEVLAATPANNHRAFTFNNFTPKAVNVSSSTHQTLPLQNSKAATPLMNNAWSYTFSLVKPLSTNDNYAVNTLPYLNHLAVEEMDTDVATTIEDLAQSDQYRHYQEEAKPESPMLAVLSKLSDYVLPLFGAFVLGGAAFTFMGSRQSTNSASSALPDHLSSPPALTKRSRLASPPTKPESLLKRALKNKTPGSPRNRINNFGTPASSLRETFTPTSVESIRSSVKSSAASSPVESSVASSPIAEQSQAALTYDWKYDFDTKVLDETFDIYQNDKLSTFLNQCKGDALDHINLRTPDAIAALETCFQKTKDYLSVLDDTAKRNFSKELEFFEKLQKKFEATKNQSDVKKQYFDTWLLIFNLHLFNSVSLRKLYPGPVVQKDEKKIAIQITDDVFDKFLNDLFETLEETKSETDALFALHNYILSVAYCGIHGGLFLNKQGGELTPSSLEQLYQYSAFFKTQFDLIYTSVECDRQSKSSNSIQILSAFENEMFEMIADPLKFNPFERINPETKDQALRDRPDLSTAKKRHLPIDWSSPSDSSSSASDSPYTDGKSSSQTSTSPALATSSTRPPRKPAVVRNLEEQFDSTPARNGGALAITAGSVGTTPGGSEGSSYDHDDVMDDESDSD